VNLEADAQGIPDLDERAWRTELLLDHRRVITKSGAISVHDVRI